jgi:hypothetical protein
MRLSKVEEAFSPEIRKWQAAFRGKTHISHAMATIYAFQRETDYLRGTKRNGAETGAALPITFGWQRQG